MGSPSPLKAEIGRFDLLRGNFGLSKPIIRPPWALPEIRFQDVCTGCDDCIEACPTSILHKARGGYPVVDFSENECTFCGDCVKACKPGALLVESDTAPWNLTATINSSCLSAKGVTCRVCGEQCETSAITFKLALDGKANPSIDSSRCTGCGACVAPCPVQSVEIHMEEART